MPPHSDGCADHYQTVGYFSPVTVNNLRPESGKLLRGQQLLEQREDDVLLVPDVRLQAAPQLLQGFGRRRFAGEILCPAAQVDVLDEHADDDLVVGGPVACQGRQQQRLLEREMDVALM